MRKVVLMAAALVAALGVTGSSATSAPAVTGITARTITIGGTFPLTGPASLVRDDPDGDEGVLLVHQRAQGTRREARRLRPPDRLQRLRRRLQPRADACSRRAGSSSRTRCSPSSGSLGTEHNEAIRPYLNARKVPQILNATGATTWGRDYKKYPWTGGWLPDYEFEGRLYGQAIARNSPNAKIAVLFQNDSFGEDNLRGSETGLGAKASNIVGQERFEVDGAADVRSQIAKLRATGATVFVIVATPRLHDPGVRDRQRARLAAPVIYTTLVSATDTFLTLAQGDRAAATS